MKKNVIALITCLMLTSLASSQKLSSDSTAVVPISALRNAIKVNAELVNTKNQLKVSRDTIKTFTKMFHKQDSIIKVDNAQISIYKRNEVRQDSIVNSYKGIVKEKENQVSDLQTKLNKSYILTGLVAAVSIFLIVLL